MAESALDGGLYDVLDRAGLHRISIDFAQPLLSAKGSDWSCELCEVKNFARYAPMAGRAEFCCLSLLWHDAIRQRVLQA